MVGTMETIVKSMLNISNNLRASFQHHVFISWYQRLAHYYYIVTRTTTKAHRYNTNQTFMELVIKSCIYMYNACLPMFTFLCKMYKHYLKPVQKVYIMKEEQFIWLGYEETKNWFLTISNLLHYSYLNNQHHI